MKTHNNNSEQDCSAVYAELQPLERHRPLIDHLFVLKDCGRLTGLDRNLFASPFSEIVLVNRHASDSAGTTTWKALHLPPRFGRQPRRQSFHGLMFGFRCHPLDSKTGDLARAELSEVFAAQVAGGNGHFLDAIACGLDALIEHIIPILSAAAPPATPAPGRAATLTNTSSTSEWKFDTSVVSMAARAGVAPRTLQRHVRSRTGLAPKRYAAIQRFNGALRQIALGSESLTHVASNAGYSDQAHLTADLARHAGLSPSRFRAQAQRQIVRDAVRFFKDADLQNRLRLLVCDSETVHDETADDKIRTQGCKLRRPRAYELRTPDRDGDTGH